MKNLETKQEVIDMFDFDEEEPLKSILKGYVDIDGNYLKIIVNNPLQWVINEVKEYNQDIIKRIETENLLEEYGFPKVETN